MSANRDKSRDQDRVRHMVQAATFIGEFMAGRTFENLLHNKLFPSAYRAVIRNFKRNPYPRFESYEAAAAGY